jgi:hypothetical protein
VDSGKMEHRLLPVRRKMKGELALKLDKKLLVVPIAALLLLGAGVTAMGAQSNTGMRVPPGELVDSPNARMANDTPPRAVPAAPGLPTGSQPGQVTESFDGSSLDAWLAITEGPANWVARDGRLQQEIPMNDLPTEDVSMLVSRDTNFADGSIETYVYPTAGTPLGIVLRGSNGGHYRVVLHMNIPNESSKAWIQKVSGNSEQTIAKATVSEYAGYNLEQWQLLKVAAQGSTITVSVDGRQILTANDSTFAEGWMGVWSLSDRGASFDNLRVQSGAQR